MEVSPAIYLISNNENSPKKSVVNSFRDLRVDVRLQAFKDYLERDGCKDEGHWPPDLLRVFDLWEIYVELPREDLALYDRIKSIFSGIWGDWYFYQMLNLTYFFHQTHWMVRRGMMKDSDYTE